MKEEKKNSIHRGEFSSRIVTQAAPLARIDDLPIES